jgi:hypothetical protein
MIVSFARVLLDRLHSLVSAALQTDNLLVWLLHPPLRLLSRALGLGHGSIRALFTYNYLAWLQWAIPSGWVTISGSLIPDDPAIAYARAE